MSNQDTKESETLLSDYLESKNLPPLKRDLNTGQVDPEEFEKECTPNITLPSVIEFGPQRNSPERKTHFEVYNAYRDLKI